MNLEIKNCFNSHNTDREHVCQNGLKLKSFCHTCKTYNGSEKTKMVHVNIIALT